MLDARRTSAPDVNANGAINASDVGIVKASSRHRAALMLVGAESHPCGPRSLRVLAGAARPRRSLRAGEPDAFDIYVTNERSGDVSVIDGETNAVVATIPAGKRPRGIHSFAGWRSASISF